MGEPGEAVDRNAERMKFFTDAVVAIAMTLLILPLLDGVQKAADDGVSTRDFLHDNGTSSSASR